MSSAKSNSNTAAAAHAEQSSALDESATPAGVESSTLTSASTNASITDTETAAASAATTTTFTPTTTISTPEDESIKSVSTSRDTSVAADASASAAEDTATPEQGEGAPAGKEVQFFKIGEDVSQFTGRPRMSAEDNQKLREGVHIVKKAMHTMASARGEEYEPFRLPAKMRAALAQIDHESELEKQKEQEQERKAAEASGTPLPEEQSSGDSSSGSVDPFAQMHSLTPEEKAEAEKLYMEQARIKGGGSRFYGKYQKLLAEQEVRKEENRMRVRRNLKLSFIVIIGLMAYVGYNFFNGQGRQNLNSIEELKAALPLSIDSYTSMVRIDDRNNDFKIFFEMDPQAFAGLDEGQKNERLNSFEHNAPLLCKNPLISSIIASGKKVTLLLEASDRSFFREFSVDKCPTSSTDGASQSQ